MWEIFSLSHVRRNILNFFVFTATLFLFFFNSMADFSNISQNTKWNVWWNSHVMQLVCVCTDGQQISWISWRSLKEVVAMWSLSFDFSIQRNNGFEGEIVAEKRERGEEGGEEGLEALFTWALNGDRVDGGVGRRMVLRSEVLFRKRVRGREKK